MPDLLPESEWDAAKAAHLSRRAGFGASPNRVENLLDAGLHGAVDGYLTSMAASNDEPDWFTPEFAVEEFDFRRRLREESPEQMQELRKQRRKEDRQRITGMRQWWLKRMANDPAPLREKMVLFWHGHFATSLNKVKSVYSLMLQNRLFRQHALGNFRELTKAVSKDPAMMQYLDILNSKSQQPNENFARELMELFTLGEGHYTEEDIRASARAFTGYRIRPRTREFFLASKLHDQGVKVFMGREGAWGGDDIIDIIFDQDQCARFITGKLWAFFAGEGPSPELVDELAADFRDGGYEISALLRTLFTSREFYSSQSVSRQIKSPVQWLVEASNELEFPLAARPPVQAALRQLGQSLFEPPNVKGWEGGKNWISTSSLLLRYNLASFLVQGPGGYSPPRSQNTYKGTSPMVDIQKVMPEDMRSTGLSGMVDSLARRLFLLPLGKQVRSEYISFLSTHEDPRSDDAIRRLLQLMMSTPQYQLC